MITIYIYTMKVLSGFTFIRNCKKYDFPFQEAVESMLPILDELVVNVGRSEDQTEEYVAVLFEKWKKEFPQVEFKRIDSVWNDGNTDSGLVLSEQTNIALSHCTAPWALYLQGDEALHEKDHALLRSLVRDKSYLDQIDGFRFPYFHFYGGYSFIQRALKWYPSEIRIIRNDKKIKSFGDAQTFRGLQGELLNTKLIDANVYHYGHARHPSKMKEKIRYFHRFWHGDQHGIEVDNAYNLEFRDLIWFWGAHPSAYSSRLKQEQHWNLQPGTLTDIKKKKITVFSWVAKNEFQKKLSEELKFFGAEVEELSGLRGLLRKKVSGDLFINLELGENGVFPEWALSFFIRFKFKKTLGHCKKKKLPGFLYKNYSFINWAGHENAKEGAHVSEDSWKENLKKWISFALTPRKVDPSSGI